MTRRHALALGVAALLVPAACHKRHKGTRTPSTPPSGAARPKVGWTESGVASWYGIPYHGRRAANGEIYDMNELTAAHRTLPFGSIVKVTCVANDKTVTVRITDRGPFVGDRIIDLSRQAARQIDMIGPGIGKVRLQLIANCPARLDVKPALKEVEQPQVAERRTTPPVQAAPPLPPPQPVPPMPRESGYAVQVGLYNDKGKAESLRDRMARRYQPVTLAVRQGAHEQWRVLVGDKPTMEEAEALATVLRKQVGEALVVMRDY